MDYSSPGSSVHEISQAEQEWVAISFSNRSSWPKDQMHISCLAGRLYHWAITEVLKKHT